MSEDLYRVLELEKGADSNDIRKQYLKLSRVQHPDKGGDSEQFKTLQRAYEILSDDEKRSFYDQTGQVLGEQGGGGGGFPGGGFPGFPFDIGSMFGMFGENGPGGNRRGPTRRNGKAPPKKSTISLSLHNFYHGKTIDIHLQQQRFCGDCRGEGSPTTRACDTCRGSGIINQIHQMGPMIIQNKGPCHECTGTGKKRGPPCNSCNGQKFVKRDKTLQINIKKGSKPGDTIILDGESSHVESWTEPGDVIVELEAAEEQTEWIREENNLRRIVNLSLSDSLCGMVMKLDGHPGFPEGFVVEILPGVCSYDKLRVVGCGMPSISGATGDCILDIRISSTSEERGILLSNKEQFLKLFDKKAIDKQGFSQPVWNAS